MLYMFKYLLKTILRSHRQLKWLHINDDDSLISDNILFLRKTNKTPSIDFQQLITGLQSTILNNRTVIITLTQPG